MAAFLVLAGVDVQPLCFRVARDGKMFVTENHEVARITSGVYKILRTFFPCCTSFREFTPLPLPSSSHAGAALPVISPTSLGIALAER
ncbi:hypothetical protein [Noviherbaspirillum sp. ST9]|uniref:hypothetical protein n=1 Tax=Noviherbaspirillum sp. ST9 TaxID=3401606 RepID=UPI003B587709